MRLAPALLAPVALGAALALPLAAQAAPLGLDLNERPDIGSDFIDVTYDAATDAFRAQGFAQTYFDGATHSIDRGSFLIEATIDDSGSLLGGKLEIGGTIAHLGFTSGTLLTGDLTAFGFPDPGGDPLEFLFRPTGGDAALEFGSLAGVILSGTRFPGTFATDWSNLSGGEGTGLGVADVAPIPEPSAALCFAAGSLLLAGAFRRLRE